MAKSFGISFTIGAKVGASVSSAFASVQDKLRSTQQAFSRTNQQSKALERAMKARMRLDDATARLRAGQGSAKAVSQIKSLAEQYARAAREAGVYGQSLEQMARKQREFARSIQESERRLNALNTIQRGRDMRLAAADSRQKAISGLMADAGTIYSMASPIRIGLQFDSAMSRVRAISGATGQAFDSLRNQARQLGATTVWSAKEAADGMTFLSMAGFKTDEILATMPGMLSLASAGAMDLASTADIASNILSGFSYSADKMGFVSDVLAKTFTSSNTSIASLGESMKYAAPVAHQAGQSFEDLAAMIGKLGDAGIQGSMAGTGLSAIIGRLSAPPKAAAEAMKALKISLSDANGKMRAMPDVFKEIGEKTANMTEEQKIAYAKALFGANHYAKGMVLMEASVSGSLQKLSASLNEKGYADKVAAEQTDNLSGDLKALDSASQDVSITIFSILNPGLRKITKSFTGVVQNVGAWMEANPRLTQGLFLVGGALTALKVGAVAFTLLKSGAKTFGLGVAQMGSMAAGPLGALRNGIGAVGRAFLKPWNFGAKAASIRQGAGSMKASLDSLRNSASQAIGRMRQLGPAGMAAATMNMTASGIARASGAGWRVLGKGIRGVGAAFKIAFGPMSILMAALSFGVDYIMENWDKISPFFQNLWDKVKAIFNSVTGWLQPAIDKISGLFDKIGEVWDWLFGNDEESEKKEAAKKKAEEARAEAERRKAEAVQSEATKRALEEERKQAFQAPMLTDFEDEEGEDEMPASLPAIPKQAASKKSGGSQAAAPGGVNVAVEINVTQNGVPDQTFAQGVLNAIKSRQGEFEQIISGIVNQQARLAYGS